MTKEQKEDFRFNEVMARQTLYPGKSYEEALQLINEKLDKIPDTISSVSEEKMYTREDFDKFCEWIDENWRRAKTKKGSGWFHVGDFYKQDKPTKTKDLAKKWFEQNVK